MQENASMYFNITALYCNAHYKQKSYVSQFTDSYWEKKKKKKLSTVTKSQLTMEEDKVFNTAIFKGWVAKNHGT